MPLHEYRCPQCGVYERLLPSREAVPERDTCPECGWTAQGDIPDGSPYTDAGMWHSTSRPPDDPPTKR